MNRTLDGVLRVVARDILQSQALLPMHQVRQRDCHRPIYRLGHPRLVCRFVVGPDGMRSRRPEGQQVVYEDVFYGNNRIIVTSRALLALTGRHCWM